MTDSPKSPIEQVGATDGTARFVLGTCCAPGSLSWERHQEVVASWQEREEIARVIYCWLPAERASTTVAGVVLPRSSRVVTGLAEPDKPLVRDVFDVLAAAADESGLAFFAYANADIGLGASTFANYAWDDLDAVAYSRTDTDDGGRVLGVETRGQDMFAIRASWWRDNRHRFGEFIIGEGAWDNIYTSILLCHARTRLANRAQVIFHRVHLNQWSHSPLAPYVATQKAAFSDYLALWEAYLQKLKRDPAAYLDAGANRCFAPPTGLASLWAGSQRLRTRFQRWRAQMRKRPAASP